MSNITPEVTDALLEFLLDLLEELGDAMQYTMKEIMEKRVQADLFDQMADCIESLSDYWGDAVCPLEREIGERLTAGREMATRLRADCERSVPVEVCE